ncbi:alpha-D-ribose 1-methylphosphonate 5-phosphate C-P-lyase PhnJ [Desulfosporosinus sp. SB140]|uniref:alpha-D-ribose 1-methylphosphonate 5-phosphate C-P-lyase PhnJ n=1 Tax=Desulfosporosinus paludis TaxID=3115649 RepID=UPI003890793A
MPPYTRVVSLDFEDYPFEAESFQEKSCRLCGAKGVFLDEILDDVTGETSYQCNDTSYCLQTLNRKPRE